MKPPLWSMHYFDMHCLISKYLEIFSVFILPLVSSLIPLWSDNILCKVLIILNLLMFVSWYRIWSVLMNVLWTQKSYLVWCWVEYSDYYSEILLFGCIFSSFTDFMSTDSIRCWDKDVAMIFLFVSSCLRFYQFLLLIFWACLVWCIHISGSSCFLNRLLCHYVKYLFVSSYFLCSEVYFLWY